ncbi:hypothetical protein PC129_g5024 [Phytophthora cactorum]|uniref:Uncharacterized protein n=4 Tax=Phytophthora cactorum TaxID=29920 RepID=A0A329SAU6_9STRA|nr:hypothetical protein Pcac1_g27606 [Phytophthora cactorum]KAG2831365.1 hypothetical protein PC112_g7293 [Phytophthora cactorum]KAG2916632.1 hypothetical protein PC114_g7403 [Phytophthora cactorum]KAG2947198.1 hypothetical protein PC117_g6998 [Phytophthora cactorum]KAG3025340.1 hypothetical protein PC120_g6534 [Phytophthora cactorum]
MAWTQSATKTSEDSRSFQRYSFPRNSSIKPEGSTRPTPLLNNSLSLLDAEDQLPSYLRGSSCRSSTLTTSKTESSTRPSVFIESSPSLRDTDDLPQTRSFLRSLFFQNPQQSSQRTQKRSLLRESITMVKAWRRTYTIQPQRTDSTWSVTYYEQERERKRRSERWYRQIRPASIGACLAIWGRILVAPLMMLLVFIFTDYLTTGTFLIEAKDSYFAFSEMDLVMSGGCTPCHIECKTVLHQMATFHHEALMSKPTFENLYTTSSWDYSLIGPEGLALAARLKASGAICSGGVDEWGSPLSIITGEAEEIVEIIETLALSVSPEQILEARKGIELKDKCVTKWAVEGHLRLFKFQAVKNSVDYSSIPAADFNVFPEYTECRPEVPYQDVVREKLALATGGEDPVLVVPDLLKLFPYGFTSSIQRVSRVIATSSPTVYPAKSVTQSLFRAYYSGCRARTVNTTGIYVEDTCTLSKRWQNYGLMLQAPDDIPVCSTGTSSICIHNYYNSLWEWVTGTDGTPGRALMKISVFRNRYADTAALSVLPGMVVLQILLMGMISLYQIMSHKRSVLLTQIWAYRCQNGRMQVLYLAQVTYHLAHNSDTYYLGLVTGTLTVESLANLTFSFFAFSYSFINLLKARSGMQKLDRHFRLTWEIMQVLITTGVASVLYSSYLTSLPWIVDYNGKLLRKTTVEGAKYCGLHDSCIVMRLNLAIMAVIASTLLGLVALSASYIVQKHSSPWDHVSQTLSRIRLGSHVMSFNAPKTALEKVSRGQTPHIAVMPRARFVLLGKHRRVGPVGHHITTSRTTFEEFCLGSEFTKLFMDCDDFAYVTFMNQRCTSVEALLLTGYLFYGKHVYQAPSVVLLLLARLFPPKFLRTFNILLLRWWVHPEHGTLTHALSCTWYTASEENYWISEATPIS